MPQSHERRLFLVLGDWFAWVAVAILVLCLVRLIVLVQSPGGSRPAGG